MPLLNIQTQANVDSRDSSRSPFTKQKISQAGRKHSEVTRLK